LTGEKRGEKRKRGTVTNFPKREKREIGYHTVPWDGRDDHGEPAASGMYFYRITTKGFEDTKKMVLMK